MRNLPTGAMLVATAAAAAAIANWALRHEPSALDGSGRTQAETSGSVALAPEVLRQEAIVRREVVPLEAAPRTTGLARTRDPRPATSREDVASADADEAREAAEAAERAARTAELEREAIAALRAIVRGQQQLQASSVIDTDGDGAGEYGYLGEVMGVSPMRKFVPGEGARAGRPGEVLNPPFLSKDFGVLSIVGAHGVLKRSAYYFQVHLPDAATESPVGALTEAAGGGADVVLPGAYAELLWGCYAWPAEASDLPLRTFFVNHEGDVLACDEMRSGYAGSNGPRFDAALSNAVAGDMRQPLGLASLGNHANDGFGWSVVGN
jgi:hypothetical protein